MALACQLPLREFLVKLEKFEASLGPFSNSKWYHGVPKKSRWATSFAEEVEKLRALVAAKTVSITLLLFCSPWTSRRYLSSVSFVGFWDWYFVLDSPSPTWNKGGRSSKTGKILSYCQKRPSIGRLSKTWKAGSRISRLESSMWPKLRKTVLRPYLQKCMQQERRSWAWETLVKKLSTFSARSHQKCVICYGTFYSRTGKFTNYFSICRRLRVNLLPAYWIQTSSSRMQWASCTSSPTSTSATGRYEPLDLIACYVVWPKSRDRSHSKDSFAPNSKTSQEKIK